MSELNEHQQSLLENKNILLHDNIIKKNMDKSYQPFNHEANDMLDVMALENNLEKSKYLFLLIQQKYKTYTEQSKGIKELYIQWAQNIIIDRIAENSTIDDWKKFNEVVIIITNLLKNNLSYIVLQHKDVLDKAILKNIKVHLNKNKYLFVDFVEMNDLKNKITNSLPTLYKNCGVSLRILDSNYEIIENYYKEDTWYSVLNSIQDSASDNMNHIFLEMYSNKNPSFETRKSHHQYCSKINQECNTLSMIKEVYNRWKTEIILPIAPDTKGTLHI